MVDLTNSVLNNEELDVAELTDGDLWQRVQTLAAHQRKGFFRVIWIPSHCDVEGPKREHALKTGIINETEIHGNSQVDILAKLGAERYALDK